jgi:hypothetical protein
MIGTKTFVTLAALSVSASIATACDSCSASIIGATNGVDFYICGDGNPSSGTSCGDCNIFGCDCTNCILPGLQTCLDNCNANYANNDFQIFEGCSTTCNSIYANSNPANKLKKRLAAASAAASPTPAPSSPAQVVAANCPNDDCTDLFSTIDSFGAKDGQMSLAEWMYYVNAFQNGTLSQLQNFQRYDVDGDGKVSMAEALGKGKADSF